MAILSGKTKGLFVPLILLGLFLALPRTAFANWIDDADTDWYTSNTSASTFTITTEEDLAGLAKLVNDNAEDFSGKTIELAGDLNLGGRDWTPIGISVRPFKGDFDGKGYSIDNLTIGTANALTNYDCAGLFGDVSGGSIENLGVINCAVYNEKSSSNTGGLAGYNGGGITNCYATGTVSGGTFINPIAYAGGLVGENNGAITNCYAGAAVFGNGTSTNVYTGGLAGQNNGTITNCYATGPVSGGSGLGNIITGGLAGMNYGDITNCYATGGVSAAGGNSSIGGLVGWNTPNGAVSQGYFNEDGANQSLSGIGDDDNNTPQVGNITGMVLADMKKESFRDDLQTNVTGIMSGWAWNPAKNHGLPYLDNGMWVVDTPTGGSNNGGNNNNGGSYSYTSGGDSARDNRDQSAGGVRADYVYRITFDTQGGSGVATQRVREGGYAEEPDDPNREGYSFTGWFMDQSCTKAYDFGKRVTASLTLYAGWELMETAVSEFKKIPEAPVPVETPKTNLLPAYAAGYPDGSFRPDNLVTRAEAVVMLYRALEGRYDASGGVQARAFTDTDADGWYIEALGALTAHGVVSGYPDGTFRPDDPVTRAEFTVMAMAAGSLDQSGGGGRNRRFSDVPAGHWAADDMSRAAENGVITGYPDGAFGPDNNITRAEAIVVINGITGRDGSVRYPDTAVFTDVPAGHWAYDEVKRAATMGGQ